MTDVTHITHLDNAISIFKTGAISPRLVYDESILNNDRILVSWLSPNDWWQGSRYGNVSFSYDFQSLVVGKRYYWVEAIPYGVHALRFLITDQDRSSDSRLIPYDPTDRTGPWWLDGTTGIHYRNGNHTLEFMLETPLYPADAQKIECVKHHETFCCENPSTCRDKNLDQERSAFIFACGTILHGINCSRLPFSDYFYERLQNALLMKYHSSGRASFDMTINLSDNKLAALGRSWLAAGYYRNRHDMDQLMPLFGGQERFWQVITELITSSFDIEKLPGILPPQD